MGRKKIWIGELRYRVETAMRNDVQSEGQQNS